MMMGFRETIEEATKDIKKKEKKIQKLQAEIKELEDIREFCKKELAKKLAEKEAEKEAEKLAEKPKSKVVFKKKEVKERDKDTEALEKLAVIAYKVYYSYMMTKNDANTIRTIDEGDVDKAEDVEHYCNYIAEQTYDLYKKIRKQVKINENENQPHYPEIKKITGLFCNIDKKKVTLKKGWEKRGDQFIKEIEQELSTF